MHYEFTAIDRQAERKRGEERSMGATAATGIDRPTSRPFGLADAMIVIIALGLGLAIARPALVLIANAVRSDPRWRFQTLDGAVSLGSMLNIVLLNLLFFLLPAFLILRLKRPRPPLRLLIGQPGFAACAAPVAVVLVVLPLSLLAPSGLGQQIIEFAAQVIVIAAVPLAWVFLIATRRWDPEPSWIDRLGRILGALWMVCVPAHFVLIHLPY
jgi:hypothetical protein